MLRRTNSDSCATFLKGYFEQRPLDPMESARRGMRPPLRARFYNEASRRSRSRRRRLPGAARRQAGADAGAAAAGRADCANWPRRSPREWEAQRDVIDPARDAADAARQRHHRWRRRRARGRSRPRSKNISAPTFCSIAPPSPEGLVARQGAALGPGARVGARGARRALRARAGRDARARSRPRRSRRRRRRSRAANRHDSGGSARSMSSPR